MNQDDKSTVQKALRTDSLPQSPEEVDQFFTKLQSDMRRPDLSQDAITGRHSIPFSGWHRMVNRATPHALLRRELFARVWYSERSRRQFLRLMWSPASSGAR